MGKPGLFKLGSKQKNGALIESLIDCKRQQHLQKEKISSTRNISISQLNEDVPLSKSFKKFIRKKKGKNVYHPKSDTKDLLAI